LFCSYHLPAGYQSAHEEDAQGQQHKGQEEEYSASEDEDSEDEEICDKENVSSQQRHSQVKQSKARKRSKTKARLPKTVVAQKKKRKRKKGVPVSDDSSALTSYSKSSRSALSDQSQKQLQARRVTDSQGLHTNTMATETRKQGRREPDPPPSDEDETEDEEEPTKEQPPKKKKKQSKDEQIHSLQLKCNSHSKTMHAQTKSIQESKQEIADLKLHVEGLRSAIAELKKFKKKLVGVPENKGFKLVCKTVVSTEVWHHWKFILPTRRSWTK
jgi:hypothetical protein